MQQLHLVGFTPDLDGLIFSARKDARSGGYLVALDDRFLAQIKEAIRLQSGIDLDEELEDELAEEGATRRRRNAGRSARHVQSALAPKEIQARLRAGRTIEEVAAEAGVDDDWIMRFATPVLAEQTRVVERAVGLLCRTPRKGESSQPLGVAVAWNLADKGLRLAPDELAAGWSAYHLRDTAWVLRFRYISRNRAQVAQWECDPAAGTLVALNRLASEIGYVEAGRRHRAPSVRDAIAAAEAAPRPVAEPVVARPVRRPVIKKVAVKKAAAKKAVAKKAVAKKAPAKRAAVKKAVTKRAPAKKVVAKKAAVKKAATKRAPVKQTARRAGATTTPRARPRSTNRTTRSPLRRHPEPAPVPRARPLAPPERSRPLRAQPVAEPAQPNNGVEAPPAPQPEPAVRQRPLVAVRRIEARQRSFPTPAGQDFTPVGQENADEDVDAGVLVIQARRASD